MDELKVFYMNEYEYYCDISVEDAKKHYLEETGVTIDEAFEGDEPYELADNKLDEYIFKDYDKNDKLTVERTFREELVQRTEHGIFATTLE